MGNQDRKNMKRLVIIVEGETEEAFVNQLLMPYPEDINNNQNTAPSKRLLKAIPGYDKVLYGVGIMECIGMETIISKCPHFREWIENLKVHLTKG